MRGIQFLLGCAFGFVFFFLAMFKQDRRIGWTAPSDLAMTLDGDCRIRSVSPALLYRLGYRADEIVGLSLLKLVHANDSQAVSREFRRAKNESFSTTWDARLLSRDESVVEFRFNIHWSYPVRQFSCVLSELETAVPAV